MSRQRVKTTTAVLLSLYLYISARGRNAYWGSVPAFSQTDPGRGHSAFGLSLPGSRWERSDVPSAPPDAGSALSKAAAEISGVAVRLPDIAAALSGIGVAKFGKR